MTLNHLRRKAYIGAPARNQRGLQGAVCLLLSLMALPGSGQAQESESVVTLTTKLNGLKSQPPLSDNELLLYQDRNALISDEARYASIASRTNTTGAEAMKAIEDLRGQFHAFLGVLASAPCRTADAGPVASQGQRIASRLSRLQFENDFENEDAWPILGTSRVASDAERCRALKVGFTPEAQRQVESMFDKIRDRTSTTDKDDQAMKQLAGEIVAQLQRRRAEVENRLKDVAGQQSVKQKLPSVIALIGGLSILVLLVVRFFPPDLQAEWINSGQVIQFVTVMVLLSVIMALGLAGIITENTLGTLLGGIAGYILSQGVGRAAAREVTKGVIAATQGTDRGP
jgi:hypothetical protein